MTNHRILSGCLLLGALLVCWFGLPASETWGAEPQRFRVEVPERLPPHPRLFLNPAEIRAILAWADREPYLKQWIESFVRRTRETAKEPALPTLSISDNPKLARQAHELALAYVLSQDRSLAQAAAGILKAYVPLVPQYATSHLKGKLTTDALAEASWAENAASAYDLIYNSGVLTPPEKLAIEQQVLKPSGEAMRHCNHAFRSNWRAKAIAGTGIIGFCINDRALIDEALNGFYGDQGKLLRDGFVQHLSWSVLADGMYYERSTSYHLFATDSYTVLMEAARNSGVDLWNLQVPGHPLDAGCDVERRFGPTGMKTPKALFDAIFYEAFSDGSFARIGNSTTDHFDRSRCYESAWRAYRDPKYAWLLHYARPVERPPVQGEKVKAADASKVQQPTSPSLAPTDPQNALWQQRLSDPLNLLWMAHDVPPGKYYLSEDGRLGLTGRHENCCTLLPNGGLTVLRQSAEPNAVGVLINYGAWGSAHTHPEQLSVVLCADRHQFVPEVRYHRYGDEDFLSWDRQTIAHNTVTVDEVSQYPQGNLDDRWPVLQPGKLARSQPEFFHAGKRLKAFRAKCNSAYEGVVLDRTTVLVDSTVVDFFRCRSSDQHQYDFAMHVDGNIQKTSPVLDPQQPGPLAPAYGYRHLTRLRRARTDGAPMEIIYIAPGQPRPLRLQFFPAAAAEMITAQGHADLKGRPKDVLILRRHGTNTDFVTVTSFPEATDRITARRLMDLPDGLLGVEVARADGTTDVLVSAETSTTIDYAGCRADGQLVLLEKKRAGFKAVDLVK